MIIHISGASGSGKTILGNKLQKKLKNKVIVIDMDNLMDLFITNHIQEISTSEQFATKYQKFIDDYRTDISKKYANIIFVGINAFVIGESHYYEDKTGKEVSIKLPKEYFDLHSDYNFYIDLDSETIIKQMYYRGYDGHINWFCNWMKNRKDIVFNELIKDEKNAQKDISIAINRLFDFEDIRKNIVKWNEYYKKKSYTFLSREGIYNKIIELIGEQKGGYYDKYKKYKSKYLKLQVGGDKTNILVLPYVSINSTEKERQDNTKYINELFKDSGKVFIYEFKFNNAKNKFTIDDYYFENASEDIIKFVKENDINKPIVITMSHGAPYGLYTVNKYPNLFSGIICYPLRLYSKVSLERRIWKFKEQGGWKKHIPEKYDFDHYYMNPTNKEVQILLKTPGERELEILFHIGDKLLHVQAEDFPKKFIIPTILFTRLDADIDSIIKLNYERKNIAEMKGIVSEKDALYNSMMWNFDRIKYDKNLLDMNKSNDNLRIRYYIMGSMEDDRNVTDAIKILLE